MNANVPLRPLFLGLLVAFVLALSGRADEPPLPILTFNSTISAASPLIQYMPDDMKGGLDMVDGYLPYTFSLDGLFNYSGEDGSTEGLFNYTGDYDQEIGGLGLNRSDIMGFEDFIHERWNTTFDKSSWDEYQPGMLGVGSAHRTSQAVDIANMETSADIPGFTVSVGPVFVTAFYLWGSMAGGDIVPFTASFNGSNGPVSPTPGSGLLYSKTNIGKGGAGSALMIMPKSGVMTVDGLTLTYYIQTQA